MPERYSLIVGNLQNLASARRSHLTWLTLACTFLMLCLWLGAGAAADILLKGLPPFCRWLHGLGSLLLLGYGIYRTRIAAKKQDLQATALHVEACRPELSNCLINAVQFSEGRQVSPAFIEALLADMPADFPPVSPIELYSPAIRKRTSRLGIAVASLWLILLFVPSASLTAAARLICPWASLAPYTRTRIVDYFPGDATLGRGDALPFCLSVSGRLPETATVEIKSGSGAVTSLELFPPGEKGLYQGQSPEMLENAQFRFLAGDARTEWLTLTILSPPLVKTWSAQVTPPPNTGRDAYSLSPADKVPAIPVDSKVQLHLETTAPVTEARLSQGIVQLSHITLDNLDTLDCEIAPQETTPLVLELTSLPLTRFSGLAGEVKDSSASLEGQTVLPFVFLADKLPTVLLKDTPLTREVARGDSFAVSFQAEDDYGLTCVGLERLTGQQQESETLTVATPEEANAKHFAGRFIIDTDTFSPDDGQTLKFRVWCQDNGDGEERRAYSPVVTVSLVEQKQKQAKREAALEKIQLSFESVVRTQRQALKMSETMLARCQAGTPVDAAELSDLLQLQTAVRSLSIELLSKREEIGGLAERLAPLVNNEMLSVLKLLTDLPMKKEGDQAGELQTCVGIQKKLLSALTGLSTGIAAEEDQRQKRDLFEDIQKLVKKQRRNIADTKEFANGSDAIRKDALAFNEDRIANGIMLFTERCQETCAKAEAGDDFAEQLAAAVKAMTEGKARENAIEAAEQLDEGDTAAALVTEDCVLKALSSSLAILNQWRVRNARKTLNEAAGAIHETGEGLEEIGEAQAKIVEVIKDLQKRNATDEEVREALDKARKEQEKMADMLENMANDLYQFPEMPVCNELNSKMREIYEEVNQAANSENLPTIKVAVQKEDSLLDAIRSTKKRIEDVEMWLMNIPDNFAWDMESFDADEFPDMPLVPLPEELEDIVGDLLDQASDIEAESQDSTGNNMIADMEMGWGVMDGPMPGFSAKGKSGNTRPNDNEMTGRSGAGREGQSNGELVENHVKGLEGRQTHARRTKDPFQKGMVTEDEDSTLRARATGGGKLGGESETIGMFGNAPRRDLHTGSHGNDMRRLRQEAEALYASAKLLYIGTGSLGEAVEDMRALENRPPDLKDLGGLHTRVLRRLESTQAELDGGVILPMTVEGLKKTSGTHVNPNEWSEVADEYKSMLQEYYKSLQD